MPVGGLPPPAAFAVKVTSPPAPPWPPRPPVACLSKCSASWPRLPVHPVELSTTPLLPLRPKPLSRLTVALIALPAAPSVPDWPLRLELDQPPGTGVTPPGSISEIVGPTRLVASASSPASRSWVSALTFSVCTVLVLWTMAPLALPVQVSTPPVALQPAAAGVSAVAESRTATRGSAVAGRRKERGRARLGMADGTGMADSTFAGRPDRRSPGWHDTAKPSPSSLTQTYRPAGPDNHREIFIDEADP